MQTNEQEVQNQAAQAQVQDELQRMLREVKVKLKGESKNELIRIIGALLLDNYALKMHLEASKGEQNENNS